MKRLIVLALAMLFISTVSLYAQYYKKQSSIQEWSIGVSFGPTNSLTDIGGRKPSKPLFLDMQLSQTKLCYGIFSRYVHNKQFSYSAWLHLANFKGSDEYSTVPERVTRGFSYKNRVYELAVKPEYNFPALEFSFGNSRQKYSFNYYLYIGLSAFIQSPEFSSPRYIEPEYLSDYKNFQIAIPYGAGGYFTFPNEMKAGIDIGFRKTFTDHFDGVTRPEGQAKDYFVLGSVNFAYSLNAGKSTRGKNSFYKSGINRNKQSKRNKKNQKKFY